MGPGRAAPAAPSPGPAACIRWETALRGALPRRPGRARPAPIKIKSTPGRPSRPPPRPLGRDGNLHQGQGPAGCAATAPRILGVTHWRRHPGKTPPGSHRAENLRRRRTARVTGAKAQKPRRTSDANRSRGKKTTPPGRKRSRLSAITFCRLSLRDPSTFASTQFSVTTRGGKTPSGQGFMALHASTAPLASFALLSQNAAGKPALTGRALGSLPRSRKPLCRKAPGR